jgi:hypothetical protein
MRFSALHSLYLIALAAAAPIDGNALAARQTLDGDAVNSLLGFANELLRTVLLVGSSETSMHLLLTLDNDMQAVTARAELELSVTSRAPEKRQEHLESITDDVFEGVIGYDFDVAPVADVVRFQCTPILFC